MLVLVYLLNFSVLLTDNAERMKNVVVGNVSVYHPSSSTTEMETDVEARVTNSDVALTQNVHLRIHHNVCVRLDTPETH